MILYTRIRGFSCESEKKRPVGRPQHTETTSLRILDGDAWDITQAKWWQTVICSG